MTKIMEKGGRTIMFGWCIFVVLLVSLQVASSLTCPPGTFLYKFNNNVHPDVCVECHHGDFMPYKDHQETQCRTCEKLEDPELEILVSPCNKTHDAVIHCVEGYYRDLARNPRETGTCQKCTKCSGYTRYTGQPCSTYRDTVCCMDENFDVVPNYQGVPLCRERPWFCRQGQYFDTRGFQCLPCPSDTFMPIDFHVRPECFKCRDYAEFESFRPLHSVIAQTCNSTHDAVLRCKDGFYNKPTMSYSKDAIGCSPCTDCSTTDDHYKGRKCDGIHDTVCCPQPNMTVVDTHDGPMCRKTACGMSRQKGTEDSSDAQCDTTNHKGNVAVAEDIAPLVNGTSDSEQSHTPKICDQNTNQGLLAFLFFVGVVAGIILSVIVVLIVLKCKNLKLYSAVSKEHLRCNHAESKL